MGFLKSVQNAATRTKLNGEILLLDHEIASRQKRFGIEFYDFLNEKQKKHLGSTTASTTTTTMHVRQFMAPFIKKDQLSTFKEIYEDCLNDIRVMDGEIKEHEQQLTILEVRTEKGAGAGIGTWMNNTGNEASVQLKITMLERNRKIRKEQFGIQVWNTLALVDASSNTTAADASLSPKKSTTSVVEDPTKKKRGLAKITGSLRGIGTDVKGSIKDITKDVKGSIKGIVSKSACQDEQEIRAIMVKAQEDISFLERSKERKQQIIDGLTQ